MIFSDMNEGQEGSLILTPDRRLRVFISSTIGELAEERKALTAAIQDMRMHPILFELGARPHPPRDLYRSYLAQSDIFVGIYWESYGWVAPEMDISGLEDEFVLSEGMPRLIYVKDPAPNRQERLEGLLDRISFAGVSYRKFSDARELETLVRDDLAVLLTERFESTKPSQRSSFPTGVVTFVFTGIEDSAALVHDHGDSYPSIVDRHDALLRSAFETHGGVEVVRMGDGFFFVFEHASGALAAAAEAQEALTAEEWPDAAVVRVRIGLHTGEAMIVEEDYIGLDVHRADGIMMAAHGGQVVLSETTATLLGGSAPVKDLGVHRLEGLRSPEHLFQALLSGSRSDFPPLRSLGPPTNIPRNLAPIVGRTEEIERLRETLMGSEHRLLTITGGGGTGKTRLALHVASGLIDEFVGGSVFVDLTDVTTGSEVQMAIGEALSFGGEADGGHDGVTEVIGTQHLLMVLDNFEKAIDSAPFVGDLIRSCENLRVLVTSQVLLRVAGELEFPLAPLGLPADEDLETVLGSEAAQLFASRGAVARPGFAITADNARTIAQTCRLLDGLPLALELAAARLKILSPAQLLGRLDDRLKLLTGGSRDAPSRHQTLRATLDWSYGLLSPEDQSFFRAFSVFVGGATFAAIEEVLDVTDEPLDRLSDLVEHSLVRRVEVGDETRFSMFATIRAYAMELLAASPDSELISDRHASYYLAFAGSLKEDTGQSLDAEHENLMVTLDHLLDRAEAGRNEAGVQAVELVCALGRFWHRHGRQRMGIAAFERALAAAQELPTELRADATRGLGILTEMTRDLERSRDLFEEALALYRSVGAKSGEVGALNSLGVTMRSLGDSESAEAVFSDTLELRREMGDERGLTTATSNLGITALERGDLDRAQEMFEASLELDRRLGDEWGVAVDLHNLAVVALERADLHEAGELVAQGLEGFVDSGDLDGVAEGLEVSAGIAGASKEHVRAVRLLAAASTLRAQAGLPSAPPDVARLERWIAPTREALSEEDFRRAWDEGAAMTQQQATRFALRPLGRDEADIRGMPS